MSKRSHGLSLYAGAAPIGVDHTLRNTVADAVRRFREVRESAPAVERTAVREASIGGATTAGPGRMLLRIISAGWSLNQNMYPAEVLRRDGPGAWPAGTRCYVDHMSDEEEQAHPSGSVKNLAAVLTENARWDEATQSLVAEARLFEPWRGPLSQMAEAKAIGMSIRAWVTGQQGERDGREGFIVDWIEGRSVDFVTVPAAGGAVISVLEAVGNPVAEAPNLGAWLESRLHLALTQYADDMYGDGRLTRPERIVLSGAIGEGLQAWTARVEADAPQLFTRSRWAMPDDAEPADASEAAVSEAATDDTRTGLLAALRDIYTADDVWVWVRDFDPEQHLVWFEVSAKNDSALWQQSYTGAGPAVALDGDPVEVVPRTVYDPVPTDAPADGAGEATGGSNPIPAAVAVVEDVTDGAPPDVPETTLEEEPVSGIQTGAPPEQAGTATVPDNGQPPATPAVVESQTTQPAVQPVTAEAMAATLQAMLAEAVKPLTAQLAEVTARESARDAENRALRNRQTASEAVTAALRASEHSDVAASITARVNARVVASVPTTAEGAVDDVKLGELVTSVIADEAEFVRRERANALAEAGVGLPYGMGATTTQESTDDDGLDADLERLFSGPLAMSNEAAKIAAAGRR